MPAFAIKIFLNHYLILSFVDPSDQLGKVASATTIPGSTSFNDEVEQAYFINYPGITRLYRTRLSKGSKSAVCASLQTGGQDPRKALRKRQGIPVWYGYRSTNWGEGGWVRNIG